MQLLYYRKKLKLEDVLSRFSPISLEEMGEFRFMNRVESKYPFSLLQLPLILSKIVDHYRILEIKEIRNLPYSSTYLDTPDHQFFFQHTRGFSERYKVRFRKYETTGESFLEVKKKGKKDRTYKWRIEKEYSNDIDSESIDFLRKHISDKSQKLNPALISRFNRITLVGINTRERITFDQNISFSKGDDKVIEIPTIAIAEIKCELHSQNSHIASALKEMGINTTGFSKYCVGRAITGSAPKTNTIKPKILLINKIENGNNVYTA